MQKCPQCFETKRQNRAGKTRAGSQRYQCMFCGKKYTPEKKVQGYDVKIRKQALRMYVDGMNFRRIGRQLGIHHTTASIWVKGYASRLPKAPQPGKVKTAELDELFTFIGNKKQNLPDDTGGSANTLYFGMKSGCRTWCGSHSTNVDKARKAKQYFSDGWEAYATLWYHLGYYQVSVGKSDTYSVEADNAEL